MKVREIMSTDVRVVSPSETIQTAARIMAEIDADALPIGENDGLVGMITDRDIAIRVVAAGKDPNTSVRKATTSSTATTMKISIMSPATWESCRFVGFPS